MFGCVPRRRITRESRRDDQLGTAAQQFDAGLVADLDPATGEQRDRAVQIGQLAALVEVELATGRAQLVVERVQSGVSPFAHVAVLRAGGLAEVGVVHIGLLEFAGREPIGGGEHRLGPQCPDARLVEGVLIIPALLRSSPGGARLELQSALGGIGTEHVAGRIHECGAFFLTEHTQQIEITCDVAQEGGRLGQPSAQPGVVVISPGSAHRSNLPSLVPEAEPSAPGPTVEHMSTDSVQSIVVSGPIFTADPDRPQAEAMAVVGDTIAYVGDADEALRIAGPRAASIDAGDGLVLPGFVDGHAHLLGTGAALTRAGLRAATSLDEITDEVQRWANAHPDAPRVLGSGWGFSAVPGGTPTRHMLDAVIADRPVYLDASDHHSVWCNTAALDELGITDTTPDPIGGRIARDSDGAATGFLLENAGYHLAWPTMNQATPTDHDRHLRAAVQGYLASGTTAAVDMGLDANSLDALLRADAAGDLPFTVVAHWLVNRTGDHADEMEQVQRAAELARLHSTGSVRIAGIKLITDGTIDGCTAGMCLPLTNGAPGDMVWPREALEPVVLAADAAGLQIALHAIGDLAVRTALDVLEVAAERRSTRGDTADRRHRIEHLEYVDAADVPRLAPLGVTASMQPVHVDPAYLGNWVELLGDERSRRGFAWPEYLSHGATLAFGTDTPTAAHHPLPNMYIAATRRSPSVPDAAPLRPDFALPLSDAIGHATRDSAWACFEDGRRGMLKVGLAADFVVLDRNPFDGEPIDLLATRVVQTVVAGRTVHQLP